MKLLRKICLAMVLLASLSNHLFASYNDINPTTLYLKGTFGETLGEKHSYGTAGMFLTPSVFDFNPFMDIKYHFIDKEKWGLNLGAGVYFSLPHAEGVFGANIYYDYFSTDKDFQQIGTGIQWLHKWFQVTLNGYIPIAKTDRDLRTQFELVNGFIEARTEKIKALGGVDFEVGMNFGPFFPCSNIDLYVGAGPYYYFDHHDKNFSGGKYRIAATVFEYLGLEVLGTYDSVFKNRVAGIVSLTYSFGYGARWTGDEKPRYSKSDGIRYYPPSRQELIVTRKFWQNGFD